VHSESVIAARERSEDLSVRLYVPTICHYLVDY